MSLHDSASRKPLRLWPGVVAAVLVVLLSFVVPRVAPDDAILLGLPLALIGVLGGVVAALAVIVWWLFFSRAAWLERLGALTLIVAIVATKPFLHPSVAGAGMGMLFYVLGIPVMAVGLVAWAVATRGLSDGVRRGTMVATILVAAGALTLVRIGGVTGEGEWDFHWRWTPTPEERLLALTRDEAPVPAPAVAVPSERPSTEQPRPVPPAGPPTETPDERPAGKGREDRMPTPARREAEWPGFRGPHRDSVIPGVRVATDWAASPPVELWRRPIGPGWSSFAVDGDLLYTQEQRGEDEIVSAYRVSTGEPVWMHRDPIRFYESNAGPGPRATPTVHDGHVYALGATGRLNALDAASGALVWSRDAAADTDRTIPDWGIAGSPLAVDDLVVVAVAGRLAAYDRATGAPRWLGPAGGGGYSSPHLATIEGIPQILLQRGSRTTSVAVSDGTLLWEDESQPGVGIVQPALADAGDVLIAAGDGMTGSGIRRIAVSRSEAGWSLEERWMSRGLKPYFNDFVVHKGHAYGFDGGILACIELEEGARRWKGGRYGHGQLVLLPDQDVLLVLSEDGELALVGATPDQYSEVARFRALDAKTWNHPVLIGDLLLVRNGEEMAAFRLTLTRR